MSMNEQAQKNMAMVNEMMAKAEAEKKAALIAQGNKAHIVVDIDYTADSGNAYKGTIIFRRPSTMDYVKMGAIKASMMTALGIRPVIDSETGIGTMAHVDGTVQQMFLALATFKQLMVDCPDWFKDYENLQDADLLIHVYARFDVELLSFRGEPKDGPATDSTSGLGKEAVDGEEAVR